MAKQKDQGDLLEIFFDSERDTLKKFQKIIRNAISLERKNIRIDMSSAPTVNADYLASLVLGTKTLKSHGYLVLFIVSAENYAILKSSEHARHFHFEVVKSSTQEIAHEPSAAEPLAIPHFKVKENTIIVEDEGMEKIRHALPQLIRSLLQQGYKQVIVDLRQLFLITPPAIQTLILETLNSGDALQIRILESMHEMLAADPQAKILNIEVDKHKKDKSTAGPLPDFDAEDSSPPFSFESDKEIAASVAVPEKESSAIEDAQEFAFKTDVNCLHVGRMDVETFVKDFSQAFQKLLSCGNQLYIDLSQHGSIEDEVAQRLVMAHFEAIAKEKRVTLRLLKPQKEKMLLYFPGIEEVEDRKDTSPKFTIIGGRLEIENVPEDLFIEEFPNHFRKLLASGQKALIVDISNLKDSFTSRCVEILVLYYLEAVGRGLSMALRIRPEMENEFFKSGRGRALPLEIVRPEVGTKVAYHKQVKKTTVDMGKIRAAMDKDRLTDKVLKKEYAAVHIEARGSALNWESSSAKSANQKSYGGPERRRDKRYPGTNMEVAFAKGSLGKFAGRRYPLRNLSLSGACFSTPISVSRGEPVRVKIYAEELSPVEFAARVVWTSPVPAQALFLIGIEFKLSELTKMQVRELIGKLNVSIREI